MDVDRLYEWQYLVVGAVGLVLTATVAGSGEYSVGVGPLAFDPFYALAGCFTFVLGWSAHTLWQSRGGE